MAACYVDSRGSLGCCLHSGGPPLSVLQVQEFMKNPKTPQQIMMEMAMKQMSGAMGSTPGAGG